MNKKQEYEHKLIDLARVTRIVAGGKRFRFRVALVVGDKKGKVGFGIAKGSDVADAISKAKYAAEKKLINIPIVNDTIPYEVEAKYKAAKVLLMPAKPGTGIIAGGTVRAIIELAGIKNILSKIKGSRNKINNALATIKALTILKEPYQIAEMRGKKLEEIVSQSKNKR